MTFVQENIIMLSTDDYDHHQKVVVVKLNNPCRDPVARDIFVSLKELAESEPELENYHGSVVISGETKAEEFYKLCKDSNVTVLWI